MDSSNKKEKRQFSFVSFLISLLITLLIFSVILFFSYDSLVSLFAGTPEASSSVGQTSHSPDDNTTPGAEYNVEPPETPYADDDYIGNTVFIGDSRTVAMTSFDLIEDYNCYAENGMSHVTALTKAFVEVGYNTVTLSEALSTVKPYRVVISYGINGISFFTEEEFFEDYQALIDLVKEASPDTDIIIQSILPVSRYFELSDFKYNNDKIDLYNSKLRQLAASNEIYYLDTSHLLKNEENSLDPKYDSGDGLHLSEAAYEEIIYYFNTHEIT